VDDAALVVVALVVVVVVVLAPSQLHHLLVFPPAIAVLLVQMVGTLDSGGKCIVLLSCPDQLLSFCSVAPQNILTGILLHYSLLVEQQQT
jgi:hypothetical protein